MASPRTIQGDVNGTGTVTYELPPGVFQYVQAIRVTVDNTAGADARPTLDIAEQAGVVIATKRQGEAIPAGGTGSATWALRLDDEKASSTPPPGSGDYVFLAEQVITSAVPGGLPLEFTNIDQTGRHLVIEAFLVSSPNALVTLQATSDGVTWQSLGVVFPGTTIGVMATVKLSYYSVDSTAFATKLPKAVFATLIENTGVGSGTNFNPKNDFWPPVSGGKGHFDAAITGFRFVYGAVPGWLPPSRASLYKIM